MQLVSVRAAKPLGRAGFVVGRKALPRAIDRNRLKRLLREMLRTARPDAQLELAGRGWDAFVADLTTRKIIPLTEGGKACRPRFAPDGTKVVYVSSDADGKGDIWLANPDGTAQERLTGLPETFDYFPAWSPDGKYAVFASGTKHYPHQGTWSLALVKIGTKRVIPLFKSGARDVFPDWR